MALHQYLIAFCVWMLASATLVAQTPVFETYSLGFVYNTAQHPLCLTDMDGDLRDELVRVGTDGLYIDYFEDADARYTRRIEIPSLNLPKWSICAGDLDGNGFIDFLLGGDKRASALIQQGRTYNQQIANGQLVSQRTTLHDIDHDGDLDAFVCNDEGASLLFKNRGDGMLEDGKKIEGFSESAGNYSAIWTDYNNDQQIDVYISKCLAETPVNDPRRINQLYKNMGDGSFVEVGKAAGLEDSAQTWTTAFEDFDNDGDMDVYLVNHDISNRLFRNNGDGSFTDVITNSGLNIYDFKAFELNTADINNDGYIDIVTDQKTSLFLGNGDLTFHSADSPVKAGALGDVNNDGFLDLARGRNLWVQQANKNHWIKFKLNGIQSNLMGIGARIVIYTKDQIQLRELRAGQGYGAMSGLHIHFGLGQMNHIDSVLIHWPSGITTKVLSLTADASYEITECEGQAFAFTPETIDSLMCLPPMILNSTSPAGKWLWSNGDSSHSIAVIRPGIYTAYQQANNGCWQAAIRYRVQLENESPPTFLRDSIFPTLCLGTEVRLPWYKDSDIISSLNWGGKNNLYVNQEGRYIIEKNLICQPGQRLHDTLDLAYTKVEMPTVDSTHWTQDSVTFFSSDPNTLWYQDDQTIQPLAQGPSYTGYIPFLFNKVFLEAYTPVKDVIQSGGRKNAEGGSDVFAKRDLYFHVKETMHLHSVDMYVLKKLSEGNRYIALTNHAGELIAGYTTVLHEGMNRVQLDVILEEGQYKLSCDRSDQAMNAGDYNYPYPLGDIGSIDSCSGNANFYPYFYNWKFSRPPQRCKSERNIYIWLATHEPEDSNDIVIYPNPSHDYIKVDQGDHNITSYTIFQSDGRVVAKSILYEKDGIKVADFSPGVYILKLKTSKGKIIAKKIIIF